MTTPPEPRRYRSRGGITSKPSRQRQLGATVAELHRPTRSTPAVTPASSVRSLDGYVRVSRVGGRSGERFISPDVQEAQIRAYAQARGHTVGTVFCELDRSGTTFRRALIQQALKRIETGESGGLIVARLDRFARTVLEALEALRRINQAGGEFISVEDGLDSSTPFGRAMMTILLALAELEAGRAREVFRSAQAHAVMRGIHVTGRLPLGYRRDDDGRLTPIPEHQQALRHAFIRRGFGALPGDIVTHLHDAGVLTDLSEKSMVRHVNYLLRNPVYTGEARCGQCINPLAHPPIVTRSLWLAAQHPRTQTTFNRNVRTLLAGLVRCGSCHGPMRHDPRTATYSCRNRGSQCTAPARIPSHQLEPLIQRRVFRWLERLDRAAARAQLATLEAETVAKDGAYGQTVAASPPGPQLAAARRASELAWLQLAHSARLALVLELPDAATLRAHWDPLTASERRHLLAAAIDTITVTATTTTPAHRRVHIRFTGDPAADPLI